MSGIGRLEALLREAGAEVAADRHEDALCSVTWLHVRHRCRRMRFTGRESVTAGGVRLPEVLTAFHEGSGHRMISDGRVTVDGAVRLAEGSARGMTAKERLNAVPACPGAPRLHRAKRREEH